MPDQAALITEDTAEVLELRGATLASIAYNGTVTDYAVPDRASVSDGRIRQPTTLMLEATISPRHLDETGAALGAAGVRRRIDTLLAWADAARTLGLQWPDCPVIPLLAIESMTEERGDTDGIPVSIRLKQIRIAQTTTIELERLKGPPRDDMAAGLADQEDTGTGTTEEVPDNRSTAALAADSTGVSDFITSLFGSG